MKKYAKPSIIVLIIMIIIFLIGFAVNGQRQVNIIMEDYQLNGGSLYYDMSYGLITWLDNDPYWTKTSKDNYYSDHYNANISVELVKGSKWGNATLKWRSCLIQALSSSPDTLYVLAGHNIINFDTILEPVKINVPHMLFSCFSTNWGSGAIVDCDYFVSPEAYLIMAGIEYYLEGREETTIRNYCAFMYSEFQHKWNYENSLEIFNP